MQVETGTVEHNYLPDQYTKTNALSINHNYLRDQFADYKEIFQKIEKLVIEGDYTLGRAVDDFEQRITQLQSANHCLGVGSGTDALMLSLKAVGVDKGDEVITTPYTFFATIGAIVTAGAKPVFVDVKEDYNIDVDKIEAAITDKTKAILPVHWSGLVCEMKKMREIADRHGIAIVEDACHAINARRDNKMAGYYGDIACFSLHPLKNLNVWGDGGYLVTNSKKLHDKLALMRNHGLLNRNECAMFAYNSRLDTLQAIVANHLLDKIETITDKRIENGTYFDKQFADIKEITIPHRDPNTKQVFHIYVLRAERRDELVEFLVKEGVDAKVHYPIPMHLQPAAQEYGYQRGDFPIAEKICDSVFSLPVHEFITPEQREYVAKKVKEFYL